MDVRHVLITQWRMCQFTGSEMVTLELAEHFAASGAKVTVVVHESGEPVSELLSAAGDVHLWSSTDEGLDEHLRADPPDLAWLHHQIIPEFVLSDDFDGHVVFNHMSAYQPLESALVPEVERRLATVSVFNSAETLDHLRDSGALDGFDPSRLRVFPNPAPDDIAEVKPRDRGDGPVRLLLVSNHVPQELSEAVALLPSEVEIVFVGAQTGKGASPARVDAELLSTVDGVVSIGKSVQYAIAAGLPVYCYDRFGGPGWLDLDNVSSARYHNFSGRGFERKDAATIAEELAHGYAGAAESVDAMRAACGPDLVLGPALDALWEHCEENPRPVPGIDPAARAAQQSVAALGRLWTTTHARAKRHGTALTKSRSDLARLSDRRRAEDARNAETMARLRSRHAEQLATLRSRHATKLERRTATIATLKSRLASTEAELGRLQRSHDRRIMRAAAAVARLVDALAQVVRRRPA